MPRRLTALIVLAVALGGCGKFMPGAAKAGSPTPSQPLLVSPEDVVSVHSSSLTSGPAITGTIQPERRADLRAEVQAVVLQVLKENGDTVRQGDLLVRLDAMAIRDALASAEAAERAGKLAFEQAERQFDRMKTLRGSGMASAQALDDAEGRRNAAQSDLEASKARLVLARQQLQRTEVRAPFDGVVTERKVSPGDTATLGKELLKVIDPRSMRFEGAVSADNVADLRVGEKVHFRVNGYGDREFEGSVRRVNPAANPTTRQVEVLVDFVGETQPKLAGLYAEGRLETRTTSSLTVPASAVVRDGDKAMAWKVAGEKLQRVTLKLADRDPRTGDYVVLGGLTEGDQVIKYPNAMLKEGQTVQASAAPKSSMAEK
jgi:membrane fusion protein (multidrug efflux system)